MKSSGHQTNQNHRAIQVRLLNGDSLTVETETKSTFQDIFQQVCDYLKLRELEFFGLSQQINQEFHFIDLGLKVQRLIKSNKGSSTNNGISLVLYFRVKFYVENVALLREKITRQLYYQQLKDNLINYSQRITEERCFILAALALQADRGNSTAELSFDPREYFPAWVIETRGSSYIRRELPNIHADFSGLNSAKAHYRFINDSSEFPNNHNLHIYDVHSKNRSDRDKKKKIENEKIWIGITPTGISFYETINGWKSFLSHLEWNDISKLHCKKKKFQISVSGGRSERKFSYDAFSELRALKLLKLCEDTHKAKKTFAPRLSALRHLPDNDDSNRLAYREALVAPSSFESRKSSASSTTTSGIASDSARDEERDREILITSPPENNLYKSPMAARGLHWTCSPSAMPWSGSPSRANSNQSNQSAPLTYNERDVSSSHSKFAKTIAHGGMFRNAEHLNHVDRRNPFQTPHRHDDKANKLNLQRVLNYEQSPYRFTDKTVDKTVLEKLKEVTKEREEMSNLLKECDNNERDLNEIGNFPEPLHTSHLHSYYNEPPVIKPAQMSVQRVKPTEFMTASSKPLSSSHHRSPNFHRHVTDPGLANMSAEELQKIVSPHTSSSVRRQLKLVENNNIGRPRAQSMTSTSFPLCPLHSAVSSEIVDAANRGQDAPMLAFLTKQCMCAEKMKNFSETPIPLSTNVQNLSQCENENLIENNINDSCV